MGFVRFETLPIHSVVVSSLQPVLNPQSNCSFPKSYTYKTILKVKERKRTLSEGRGDEHRAVDDSAAAAPAPVPKAVDKWNSGKKRGHPFLDPDVVADAVVLLKKREPATKSSRTLGRGHPFLNPDAPNNKKKPRPTSPLRNRKIRTPIPSHVIRGGGRTNNKITHPKPAAVGTLSTPKAQRRPHPFLDADSPYKDQSPLTKRRGKHSPAEPEPEPEPEQQPTIVASSPTGVYNCSSEAMRNEVVLPIVDAPTPPPGFSEAHNVEPNNSPGLSPANQARQKRQDKHSPSPYKTQIKSSIDNDIMFDPNSIPVHVPVEFETEEVTPTAPNPTPPQRKLSSSSSRYVLYCLPCVFFFFLHSL
jgi:hypothetical protein